MPSNSAVYVNTNTQNDKTVQISITQRGSSFYFGICAVMGFTALAIVALSTRKPRSHRVFFYLSAALNMTACIAYFTMGSNLGWAPIDVEFQRSNPVVAGINRSIFYARYVDWVITTPLLLLDLMLTAAMPWPTMLYVIFLDEVMIVTGLIGALVKTRYKFGFFAFGCVAMLFVFYELAVSGRKHARALGPDVARAYNSVGVWTLFLWTLYPIAWGLSEGGNIISPDSEAVFYGVLDFCAKPLFSALLIYGHWNIDPARLGVEMKDYNVPMHEKSAHTDTNNDYGTPVNRSGAAATGTTSGHTATPADASTTQRTTGTTAPGVSAV